MPTCATSTGPARAASVALQCEAGYTFAAAKPPAREFVGVKLDDPSFAPLIYANLIERKGQHELIWSR